jgi:hypothetical protein
MQKKQCVEHHLGDEKQLDLPAQAIQQRATVPKSYGTGHGL